MSLLNSLPPKTLAVIVSCEITNLDGPCVHKKLKPDVNTI